MAWRFARQGKTTSAADFPEVLAMLEVSGPHCAVPTVAAASVAHLEELFERLGQHGELLTSMVWSSALDRRVIDWAGGVPQPEDAPPWG